MPYKDKEVESGIKQRWFKAMRFILADIETWDIHSREEFAKVVEWEPSSLTRAEKKDNFYIPAKQQQIIILKFGVDAYWLMTGENEYRHNAWPVKSKPEVSKKQLSEATQKATSSNKKAVKSVVK